MFDEIDASTFISKVEKQTQKNQKIQNKQLQQNRSNSVVTPTIDRDANFFFEKEQQDRSTPILKIDAIKISLCLSVQVLSLLVGAEQTKSKIPARKDILNKIDRLYMFLVPFLKYEDKESLPYVLKVVQIIWKCTQEKLHQ